MKTRRNNPNASVRPKAGRRANTEEVASLAETDPKAAARAAAEMIASLPPTHNEVRRLLPVWVKIVTEIVAAEPKRAAKKTEAT